MLKKYKNQFKYLYLFCVFHDTIKLYHTNIKYATRIKGSYYYHSILYDPSGTRIIDDRLGEALSHGCIRLAPENAKWIYDNILDGTTVVIH